MRDKGIFITFEGGEGSGKTTQINMLSQILTNSGVKNISTREPGGTSGAEIIRDLIEISIAMERERSRKEVKAKAELKAEENQTEEITK